MYLNPKGRNWGDLVNWDDLGKLYAGFAILWTIILYSGIAWLALKRNLPCIKIRNLPLAVAATSFLHVYLIKILLAYTTNGHFLCSAEFWVMSIYLPFGIALFQANLAQLRSISEQQRKFVDSLHTPGHGFRGRWQNASYLTKTYIVIGIGMACQLVITSVLYATSPTLQGDWSSYGKLSHAKGQAKCRKSPEWIASAFWQLFYSWCYAPYTLYRIRNIHDTHYWKLQVILSIVSGLPGTPLWLAALYSTSFEQINSRWVPPMWLAPGIIIMQSVTIFFPIYEAIRSRTQYKSTLSVIKEWEDRRGSSQRYLISDSSTQNSGKPSTQASTSVSSLRKAHMRTMAGLEKALDVNPEPLLKFAATQDFTAENIVFLMQVNQWQKAYSGLPKIGDRTSECAKLYVAATQIYANNVNDKTCDFPINIESNIRRDLDTFFAKAVPKSDQPAVDERGKLGFVNPFTGRTTSSSNSTDFLCHDVDKSLTKVAEAQVTAVKISLTDIIPEAEFPHHPGVEPLGKARAYIPENFDEHVFDDAVKSIKYLVLTNTWQKFVKGHEELYGRIYNY